MFLTLLSILVVLLIGLAELFRGIGVVGQNPSSLLGGVALLAVCYGLVFPLLAKREQLGKTIIGGTIWRIKRTNYLRHFLAIFISTCVAVGFTGLIVDGHRTDGGYLVFGIVLLLIVYALYAD